MAAPRPDGNPRTDQAARFKVYTESDLRDHRLVSNQTEAEAAEAKAANPVDGSVTMSNTLARWGRPIVVGQFKSILQRLNPSITFELSKSDPDKYGVYVTLPVPVTLRSGLVVDRRFICGMISGLEFGGIDTGLMPEFSIIETRSVDIPDRTTTRTVDRFKREIRGWRTVLAALIIEGLITEPQVERTFAISHGGDSRNWQNRIHRTY